MVVVRYGFSLLELTVVIALVIFLSMIALPGFMKLFAKAKRTEAYVQLRALYIAQKAYFAEHGTYTTQLTGAEGLGWKPEGEVQYTYGFSTGKAGKNYLMGSLKTPVSALKNTFANNRSFTAAAAGDIDGDGDLDIITINQDGAIVVVQDDLA